jgi:hypothetical protein
MHGMQRVKSCAISEIVETACNAGMSMMGETVDNVARDIDTYDVIWFYAVDEIGLGQRQEREKEKHGVFILSRCDLCVHLIGMEVNSCLFTCHQLLDPSTFGRGWWHLPIQLPGHDSFMDVSPGHHLR